MTDAVEDVIPQPGATSYFSEPEARLDPALFDGMHLKPSVRDWVLGTLHQYLRVKFPGSQTWAEVWIAGSGASYQWSAAREPGDLDILIGIDYYAFRRANPGWAGLSNVEISKAVTGDLKTNLWPQTSDATVGTKRFEVTWYVNPGATDIRSINPYAAYDVTRDEWTVWPKPMHAPDDPKIRAVASKDEVRATRLLNAYNDALGRVSRAMGPVDTVNNLIALDRAEKEATMAFDDLHLGRHAAFAPGGQGYGDVANYRWQAGKAGGYVQALGEVRRRHVERLQQQETQRYGQVLPDVDDLITRAATYRSVR